MFFEIPAAEFRITVLQESFAYGFMCTLVTWINLWAKKCQLSHHRLLSNEREIYIFG